MQPVDILRDHGNDLPRPLQLDNGFMCCVRPCLSKRRPRFQLIVPVLHPCRFRSHKIGVIHRLASFPNAVRSAKIRDATLGGDARAGKDQGLLCPLKQPHQLLKIVFHLPILSQASSLRHPVQKRGRACLKLCFLLFLICQPALLLYVAPMPVPVLTIAQMRDWEKATWATGQTETEVIRRVGREVARFALHWTKPGDLILILAGKGHNGEDARSAREHLTDRRVDVLDVSDPAADFQKLEALLSLGPALVIDGLFGIGINRPLSQEWTHFIERVNQTQADVLAVDVPSGLDADSGKAQGAAIQASITATVGAPKSGLLQPWAWPYVGRLEVTGDVGLTACTLASELQWTLSQDFFSFPPRRAVATHKGTYGHLGIIAGSLGYHGAAVLAARGAQRAQPGLITVCPLENAYLPIAAQLQAVMVSPWRPDRPLPDSLTAFLIGPGLAASDMPVQMKDTVRQLWRESPLPVIADASALDWLPTGSVARESLRVITPHPGEAARLLDTTAQRVQANRVQAVRDLSKKFGNTWVVLKGHQTLIGLSTGAIYVNSSGNPHLAQGGSGDVLGGYLAGLLTQSPLQADPLNTIRYAVWQHGATADHLQHTRPAWAVEDLLLDLGQASDF